LQISGTVSATDLVVDTDTLYVDSTNDRVGIGTPSPSANLEIIQSGNNVGLLVSGGGYNYTAKFESSDAEANIIIEDSNSTNNGNMIGVATDDMYFLTAGAERMRIENSGNVGINASTVSPIGSSNTTLQINGANTTEAGCLRLRSTNGGVDAAFWANSSAAYFGTISNDPLTFRINNSERMRIDSSGNVGIGTSSPSLPLEVYHASNSRILASTSNTGASQVCFGDDADDYVGRIYYAHHDDTMRFHTNGSEAMRIDSSGNLILKATSNTGNRLQINGADETSELLEIGITSGHAQLTATHASGGSGAAGFIFRTRNGTAGTNEKMRLNASGHLLVGTTTLYPGAGNTATGNMLQDVGTGYFSRASGYPLGVNRNSNGTLINLGKDGSTVGSIGTLSSRLHIENGDTGLRIAGDLDQIFPCGSGGGDRDAAIDLGSTGVRFKDLYLSGGVYLGGTGSANHLDDYEKGTFNPVPSMTGNNLVYNLSGTVGSYGRYTKVGNLVTCWFDVYFNVTSGGTGQARLGGFPFSTTMSTQNGGYSAANLRNCTALNASVDVTGYIWNNNLYFEQYTTNTAAIGYITGNNIRVTGEIVFYIS
jgi:hypothetical protein